MIEDVKKLLSEELDKIDIYNLSQDDIEQFDKFYYKLKAINKRENYPVIARSGDTFVMNYKGKDYLYISDGKLALFEFMEEYEIRTFYNKSEHLNPSIIYKDNTWSSIATNRWRPIEVDTVITDEIAKLRPLIVVTNPQDILNGNPYRKLLYVNEEKKRVVLDPLDDVIAEHSLAVIRLATVRDKQEQARMSR